MVKHIAPKLHGLSQHKPVTFHRLDNSPEPAITACNIADNLEFPDLFSWCDNVNINLKELSSLFLKTLFLLGLQDLESQEKEGKFLNCL